jgi:hypothetical protein
MEISKEKVKEYGKGASKKAKELYEKIPDNWMTRTVVGGAKRLGSWAKNNKADAIMSAGVIYTATEIGGMGSDVERGADALEAIQNSDL